MGFALWYVHQFASSIKIEHTHTPGPSSLVLNVNDLFVFCNRLYLVHLLLMQYAIIIIIIILF